MRRSPLSLPAVLLAGIVLGGCLGGDDDAAVRTTTAPAGEAARPSPAITRGELREHLAALQRIADGNDGTRAAGTPGYEESVDYVAARLEDAGWSVTRQPVPFTLFELRSASLAIGGHRLRPARDFQVYSYSGAGRVEGRLEASGVGCEASDFDGLEPGQIPLVGRGDCFTRVQAGNAQRAGAKALVVQESASRRGVPSGTLAVPGIRIPVVVTSTRALGSEGDGSPARVSVDAASSDATTENLIAETPGGSDEHVVMAGGHLDSVRGGPGIDDNGSGVAALIEAAEAIGPNPPGAKVRFGFWTAEELGLIGSRRYVRSLDRADRGRIEAYLNFDMVGSPNAVPAVYGDGADPELARVLRASTDTKLGEVSVGQSSDHTWFDVFGIPIGGLYTGSDEAGPGGKPRDPCYHLACDTTQNVDLAVLTDMAKTTAAALRTLSRRHK